MRKKEIRDIFILRTIRHTILSTICIFPLGVFFGWIGISIGVFLFGFSILPLLLIILVELFSFHNNNRTKQT